MRSKALYRDFPPVRALCAATLIAGSLAFTAGMAKASSIVQFDQNFGSALLEGTIVSDGVNGAFNFGNGLTGNISTSNPGSRATGRVQIFDTNPGTGSVLNDPDLLGPFSAARGQNLPDLTFGNALILEETRGSRPAPGFPDDAANGGRITFAFDVPIALTAIFLLDAGDNAGSARIFLDDVEFDVTSFLGLGPTQTFGGRDREYDFIQFDDNTIVNSFSVEFPGSGAIGRFGATVVPVPATLPLLLTGLGAFAWVARKRKKRA